MKGDDTHRAVADMLTEAVRQMVPVRLHVIETQHDKQATKWRIILKLNNKGR